MFSSQEIRATLNEKLNQLKAAPEKDDDAYRELAKTSWNLCEVLSKYYRMQLHKVAEECIGYFVKIAKRNEHELKVIEAKEVCDTLGENSNLIRNCLSEENRTNPKKVTGTISAVDQLIKFMCEIKSIDEKWMTSLISSFGEAEAEGAGKLEQKDNPEDYRRDLYKFDMVETKYKSIAGNSAPITATLLYSTEKEKVEAILQQIKLVNEDLKSYPNYLHNRVDILIPSANLRRQKQSS